VLEGSLTITSVDEVNVSVSEGSSSDGVSADSDADC
jgi:hypothetical protein